jgi:hypothetical protein
MLAGETAQHRREADQQKSANSCRSGMSRSFTVRRLPHELHAQGAGDARPLGDAELSQLHLRVPALEELATALLADASGRQLDLVRKMDAYVIPRPGYTQHPLTTRAAMQMIELVGAVRPIRE